MAVHVDREELRRVVDELPSESVAPVTAILRRALALSHRGVPWDRLGAALGSPAPGPALQALADAWEGERHATVGGDDA